MDKEITKTMVLEAIRRRRSSRVFLRDPVPEDILAGIVEAGRYAPSSNNSQLTHFYVITNTEKLAELRAAMTAGLAGMQEQKWMSPFILNLIARAKEGEVDVAYDPPALIVTTNTKGMPNAIADCSCALQNMMLAASVFGIANVWINQFFQLRDEPPVKAFFASIGVSDEEEICGALSLGYAEKIATEPLPRTGFPVTYIR